MADPFKLNGDYITGMMYTSRRQYLSSDNPNKLEPPKEFMTKKQSRVRAKISRDAEAMSKVDFNNILQIRNTHSAAENTHDGDDSARQVKGSKQTTEKANKKATKQKRPALLVAEEFSSVDPNDWIEQTQAGCKLYVNPSTGEVSAKCPWAQITKQLSKELNEDEEETEEEKFGTGSLVYDGSEFDSLMKELDKYSARQSLSETGKSKK
jgi:hypothetical protein